MLRLQRGGVHRDQGLPRGDGHGRRASADNQGVSSDQILPIFWSIILYFLSYQVGPANQTLPINTLAVLPCEASGEF